MALDQDTRSPRTIYLGGGDGPGGGGGLTKVDEFVSTGTPLPGMLAEKYNDSGVTKWRAHSGAAGTFAAKAFYLERLEHNQSIDDAYEDNELALVGIMYPGSKVYALVPSGANIVANDALESNGDGYLKEGTTAPVARALESTGGAVTAATRVRVEVL
jgi:hypothetical protein